jgi:hypothetical protein
MNRIATATSSCPCAFELQGPRKLQREAAYPTATTSRDQCNYLSESSRWPRGPVTVRSLPRISPKFLQFFAAPFVHCRHPGFPMHRAFFHAIGAAPVRFLAARQLRHFEFTRLVVELIGLAFRAADSFPSTALIFLHFATSPDSASSPRTRDVVSRFPRFSSRSVAPGATSNPAPQVCRSVLI